MKARDVLDLERYLTPKEREELNQLVLLDAQQVIWRAQAGPQSLAYECTADVLGFGGAAGGGKTDLALGKALTQHQRAFIVRKNGTEHTGFVDRITELLGTRDGFSSKDGVWRDAGPNRVQIEFGSLPNPKDEEKYRGRPHDLLVFDEATSLTRFQVQFLMAWNRTTTPGLRCQTLLTFNPPSEAAGRWVMDFFGPWLNKKHPLYPTPPGVLRYVAMLPAANGETQDLWQTPGGSPLGPAPFVLGPEGELVYGFDPAGYKPEEIITPQSRTFIPSRVSDNAYLSGSGYLRQLQALPEPLRSQMLNGDFEAGMQDSAFQVIPTAWVEAAMARWRPRSPRGEMLCQGVDVARGGRDNTTQATRHVGNWYDKVHVYPGTDTPDGPRVAGLVIAENRDQAPIALDIIGVGSSPYDFLHQAKLPVYGVNVADASTATDKSGRLTFFNLRSELWWKMREELDPANDTGIALPPDQALLAELCAPMWEMSGRTIKVESRDDIVKRTGRSPDRATAVILARMDIPKIHLLQERDQQAAVLAYDPYRR